MTGKPIGIILAGGRSSRMQGQDKGLINLDGQPMIEHVLTTLRHQVSEIIISANRNLDKYARYDYTITQDETADYQGPLMGMLSAMRWLVKDSRNHLTRIIVVPCDAPYIPPDLVNRLSQCAQQQRGTADIRPVVVHDGIRLQPLFLLLPLALTSNLEHYLGDGHRKVRDWIKSVDPVIADCSDIAEAFVNINTLQQLALHGS